MAASANPVSYRPGEMILVRYLDERQWRELLYVWPAGHSRSYVQHPGAGETLEEHALWRDHLSLDNASPSYPDAVGDDEVIAFWELPQDA